MLSLKKQKGFTSIELFIVIWILVVMTVLGGIGYVAIHFLSKWW